MSVKDGEVYYFDEPTRLRVIEKQGAVKAVVIEPSPSPKKAAAASKARKRG